MGHVIWGKNHGPNFGSVDTILEKMRHDFNTILEKIKHNFDTM
jgi:hypothetical protein